MEISIIEKFYSHTLHISKHLGIDILKHFQNSSGIANTPGNKNKETNHFLISFYKISKEYLHTEVPEDKDLHKLLEIEYEVVLFCLNQDVQETETLDIQLNTTREYYLQLNPIALLEQHCIINPLSKITSISLENKEYIQLLTTSESEAIHILNQLIHLHTDTPTSNVLKHPITSIEYEFITLFETRQHIGNALQEVGFETTVKEGKLIDEDIDTALNILRNCIYKKFIIVAV